MHLVLHKVCFEVSTWKWKPPVQMKHKSPPPPPRTSSHLSWFFPCPDQTKKQEVSYIFKLWLRRKYLSSDIQIPDLAETEHYAQITYFNIHSFPGIEFGDYVQKDFINTAVWEPRSIFWILFHRHLCAPAMVLPFPSDGKAMCSLCVLQQTTQHFPRNGLAPWLTHYSISSSKAAILTKCEKGNLDNILQGDCWFHCFIIQLQHEAQHFLQRITQLSLRLAVESPVQGFIDHHSQVLQQLQAETMEAVQHKALWRTSQPSLPSHTCILYCPSGLSISLRMRRAQKAARCSSGSLKYSLNKLRFFF